MASTYVNDLRLNEMATGDQSGSWGTVTNTNLELIAEAFSFGTEGITTNADTHTTTIADGATDPGRSMFLKYTGTLDSACTITIAPNTVSKLWFIENATSGSQNIIIKQGSGATITIPPGDTKAIYSDGAGSGGKMVDAFASLSVVDLKVQDDLTVTDDVSIGGILGVTGVLTTTAATVFNGGFASVDASTIIAADGAADNQFSLIIKNEEATDDRSYGLYIQAGSTVTDSPLHIYEHTGSTQLFRVTGTGQALFTDGSASLPSVTNIGDTNTGIFFPAADTIGFSTNTTERLRISSAGLVGIGTSSASAKLHVDSGTTDTIALFESSGDANAYLVVKDSGSSGGAFFGANGTSTIIGTGGTTERLRIDSSGNVGIGHVPSGNLTAGYVLRLDGGAQTFMAFNNDTHTTQVTGGFVIGNDQNSARITQRENQPIIIETNNTERLRIDNSGTVLVGKTSTSNLTTTAGHAFYGNGEAFITRAGTPLYLGRTGSDGEIANFYKDGTAVGTIKTFNSTVQYGGAAAAIYLDTAAFLPANASGRTDNTIDLGSGSHRYDDVFATNGTIQTSDRNEKQDIAALTSAEMLVAKRISALFKTFRWKDKVAAKGENARTHSGIIAQDVQAAFTAESLDAGDYALFISSTWWETQTEVPAVEAADAVYEDVVIAAIEEELDEEGNVLVEAQEERTEQRLITEAVEAADAYTRTDTYYTESEAPEGATSRTRLGVRYPELLSFLAAYNEQRFASIETRLTALENA